MKTTLILFFIVPFLSLPTQKTSTAFIGKWVWDFKGELIIIEFDKSGWVSFTQKQGVFGGKEFIYENEKCQLTYEIATSFEPIQIDFIVTKLRSGERKKYFLGIAEFKGKDTLLLGLDFHRRPSKLTDSHFYNLKRTKFK